DMENYYGSTKSRRFGVTIEPYGGGLAFQTNTVLTAEPGTANYDTGDLTVILDLAAYSGRAVRVSFDTEIPESFTGPGFLALDNVLLTYPPIPPLQIARSGPGFVLSWPAIFSNFVVIS